MKTTLENNTLTIFLEGRIDTNNAAQTEQEIFAAAGGSSAEIVVDAEKLEYISSAGLRVLMKLRKQIKKPLPLVNVSRDVFDILETTGFTELFDVRKALREMSVEGCEVIGKGGYGTVYRIDKETILKVYNQASLDVIEGERTMSQRAFVNGLPTAIPYDTVKVGDKFGVVYEMIDARTIAQIINADPSKLEEYTKQYAAALKEFHSIEMDDELFEDKKKELRATIDIITPYVTDEEIALMKDYLDSVPDKRVFIHGDYNLKNVMVKDGELMLIDIGDAGVGHPIFDVASVWLFCKYTKKTPLPPEYIRMLMGFDPELSDRVWEVFFDEYFGTSDPAVMARTEDMIKPMAYFLVAHNGIRRIQDQTEEMMQRRVEGIIRGLLLPAIKNAVPLNF